MRALVLDEFWAMSVAAVDEPQTGDGDVVLDVVATGICGSDVHGYTGENGRRFPGQVMGHETVGRIRALGAGADGDLAVGDAVAVNPVLWCGTCTFCRAGREQACPAKKLIGVAPEIRSAFAERLIAPVRNTVKLAAGMPIEHGALVEPLPSATTHCAAAAVAQGSPCSSSAVARSARPVCSRPSGSVPPGSPSPNRPGNGGT